MIGERISHNEETPLIHGHLCIVILLKTGIRRVFHDARLRVGKVVLVAGTCSWLWWRRWTTTRATPRRTLALRTLRHPRLIVGLLGCRSLLGTGFKHGFGLRQTRQAVLPPRNLVADHQPIGHLRLLTLFAQSKELF